MHSIKVLSTGKIKVTAKDDDGNEIGSFNIPLLLYSHDDLFYAHSLVGNLIGCGESIRESTIDLIDLFKSDTEYRLNNINEHMVGLTSAPEEILDMYIDFLNKVDPSSFEKDNKKEKMHTLFGKVTHIVNTLINDKLTLIPEPSF